MEDVNASISKALEAKVANQIASISTALGTNNVTMEENVFVNRFLPNFHYMINSQHSEDLETSNDSKFNEFLTFWISYAGGPFNRVDIIDSLGKLKFTVPPIHNDDYFEPKRYGKLAEELKEAELLSIASPMAGSNKKDNSIFQTFDASNAQIEKCMSNYISEWVKIFSMYNLSIKDNTSNVNVVNEDANSQMYVEE